MQVDQTNQSLLRRVRDPADRASWDEFYKLYAPLLLRYARSRGLSASDAEDAMQECMRALSKAMPIFEYRPNRGRFKSYLRTLANNTISNMFRRKRPRLARSGELTGAVQSDADAERVWEKEWRREHLAYCLSRIESRFSKQSIQAFKYHVLKEWPVERVCEELEMTANQVYLAKSRVTRRLREEMTRLVGESA